MTRFTVEQLSIAIPKLRSQGLSTAVIMERLGIAWTTARKYGVRSGRHHVFRSEKERREIIVYPGSNRETAKRLGVTVGIVAGLRFRAKAMERK